MIEKKKQKQNRFLKNVSEMYNKWKFVESEIKMNDYIRLNNNVRVYPFRRMSVCVYLHWNNLIANENVEWQPLFHTEIARDMLPFHHRISISISQKLSAICLAIKKRNLAFCWRVRSARLICVHSNRTFLLIVYACNQWNERQTIKWKKSSTSAQHNTRNTHRYRECILCYA